MQPTLCSRCKKNVAVIFITRLENGAQTNEGLCLKCAKELNIKPVDDIMKRMGISDEDVDNLSDEMLQAMAAGENLPEVGEENENDEEGKTATFPFLSRLFGAQQPGGPAPRKDPQDTRGNDPRKDQPRRNGKFLDSYSSPSPTGPGRASWTGLSAVRRSWSG